MSIVRPNILLIIAGAAAVWGVLQMDRLPGQWGHVCGPWGCGPSIKALTIWHVFWATLLVPPVWTAIRYLPTGWLRRLGLACTMIGLTALLALAAMETVRNWPDSSNIDPWFFAARFLFSVVTLVDVPVIQVTFAGLICWLASIRRGAR
jgi:hypothetical protein